MLTCRRCGADITHQREGKSKRAGLCARCGRAERLSAYFKQYYQRNKEKILAKNRRWAAENKERVAELRRIRLAKQPRAAAEPKYCIDCGDVVQRALRCRKCYVRHKYHTDPEYRAKRLATTKRWAQKKREELRLKKMIGESASTADNPSRQPITAAAKR